MFQRINSFFDIANLVDQILSQILVQRGRLLQRSLRLGDQQMYRVGPVNKLAGRE